jgi:Tfp pilus assembly protein PilN
VLLAAILVARYFFGVQNDNIQRTVDLNNAKIASLQPVQKQAEELSATVNTISGLLSRNVKFSDMLTQIGGIMPPGSVLTGLKFSLEDVEAPLVVSAQVDNEQKAAVLRNNLAASSLFEKAELKNITKIEEKDTTTPTNPSSHQQRHPTCECL